MKQYLFLIILLFSSINFVFGQEKFISNQYGFSMQVPTGWIETTKSALTDNIKKFELTDEALAKILKENNGSIVLAAWFKYDPKTKPGLIPTIQIRLRPKPNVGFADFKRIVIQSLQGKSKIFEGYEIVGEPKEIQISGVSSVFVTSKFDLKGPREQVLKVRSRTYAIPRKNFFIQANFTDGYEGDDCSAEFDKLVETINID